jgi:heptosyltransferase-3
VASRLGGAISPIGRRLLQRILDLALPLEQDVPLERIGDVRSILLVRPNFRLGNALITSPLVAALRERFPGARLDYLGGEGTMSVLDGLPVDEHVVMSRGFVLRPWRFVALFVRLRRRRYDVAVEGAMGSFSGGLYTFLSGARHRIGVPRRNERLLNVRLPATPVAHAYDGPVEFARHLGVSCADRPLYAVKPEEAAAARSVLAGLGLARDGEVAPFVAIFVGGHGAKRWPRERWAELTRQLAGAGAAVVLFAGPEEADGVVWLSGELRDVAHVVGPQPLRVFAALLAAATLVVTPDSGPMHLGAAVGTPVIAVLAARRSRFFQPRGPLDVALAEPTVADVTSAILAHPRWPALVEARRGETLQQAGL